MDKAQKLFVALSDLFRDYRAEYRRILTKEGLSYNDPLADVRLRRDGDKLILTYDGEGYCSLSCKAVLFNLLPQSFKPTLRQQVFELASKYGYKAEDASSWSMELFPEII